MASQKSTRLRIVRCSAIVSLVVGLAVLTGWIFDIPLVREIAPGFVTMNPLTALLFVVAGAALFIQSRQGAEERRIGTATLAGIILLLAGLKFLHYATGKFAVDQVLFAEAVFQVKPLPSKMAPNTALNFALVGLSLIAIHSPRFWVARVGVIAAWIIVIPAMIAIAGYLYGIQVFYRMGVFYPMAVHTAVTFLVLAAGLLCLRPDIGLVKLLLSDTVAAPMLRRLLPVALVVPFVIGYLRLVGQRAGYYETEFGLAIYVVLTIFLFAGMLVLTAAKLHRVDVEKKEREAELNQLRELLPICSYCKSIRDDQNYWRTVESYFSHHTSTKFSHGICPECYKKLIAEYKLTPGSSQASSSEKQG
jgi:hypothetical protein